jgi:hypothetical protein
VLSNGIAVHVGAGVIPVQEGSDHERRDCPRNCVGMNERDAHAYDYEKQEAAE